jgi:hypothetical protein
MLGWILEWDLDEVALCLRKLYNIPELRYSLADEPKAMDALRRPLSRQASPCLACPLDKGSASHLYGYDRSAGCFCSI